MRARVATLILLSLLTFVLGLGRQAISDGDEGYYAEAAREMVESGDWLTPHFNYVDRWQKPILYYWATAATFLVTGVNEWAARAFSALSGVLLVLLTWAIGRRTLDNQEAAWIGAAIVATCYGYFALARLALPDLPLALFITLTIYLWIERSPGLAGAAAALGFLDKGPLALVVPALVLIPMAWRERREPDSTLPAPVRFAPRDIAIAGLTFLVIATPWYASMFATHGTAYLDSFFIGDNLERFATDRFNSPRAFWFYVPILIGGIFPWTMFLLVLPWPRMLALAQQRTRLSIQEWRLLLWVTAPLLFFTASIGKQPRYILPLLPPLALLLGGAIRRRMAATAEGNPRARRELLIATWSTVAVYVLLALLLYRAGPILINAYPALTLTGVGVLVLAAWVLALTAVTERWARLPLRMAAGAALVLLSVQFGVLAGIRPEAVEAVARLVRENRTAQERIGTYQVLERNLVFYTGLPQVTVFDDRQALDFLSTNERVLLVGRAQDLLRLQTSSGLPLKALGSVDYLDPATIRLSTLLSPLRRRDVTNLLVVSNR